MLTASVVMSPDKIVYLGIAAFAALVVFWGVVVPWLARRYHLNE